MAERKGTAKKAAKAVKKAATAIKKAAKRVAKKSPAPARAPARKPKETPAIPSAAEKKKPARRPPGSPPVERTRVVIPMDVYEPQKDIIKAPLKAAELKWNFLGEGKGLYKRADNGVHCFTQFQDDGVHYSVWGDDKPAVQRILDAWKGILGAEAYAKATSRGEQAVAAEKVEKESEALRLWKLGEPQRRPGEPDLFYQKRLAEWQAKKPA